jgi:hypothetical protein
MGLPITLFTVRVLSLALVVSVSTSALAMDADQVILKNGDRITGHVVNTSADMLGFATEAAGTIHIRRDAIDRVIAGTGTSEKETPGPEMVVQPAVSRPAAQPSANCMAKLKPVPEAWSFTLLGAPNKVVLGTQSQEQFGASLDVNFCEGSRRDTTSVAASGSHVRAYEQGAASIQTDVVGAEIEQQHFFHSPQGAAVYGVGELFTNNSLGMAMQKSAGVGLLSPQYRVGALSYDFAADVRYLNQHLDHFSPALNFAAIRLKEQMHLQGRVFRWDEQGWIMPVLNDVHALQAYASFGPSVALKPWLQLGLTAEESYLGNAPSPNRKNYYSSALTLSLQGGSGSRSK